MLRTVLIAALVVLSGFFIYVAAQPSEMKISREVLINAPPDMIFPHINNSRKANEWMPWDNMDPQAKMNYTGPDEGVGSTTSWDSDGKMGTGKAVVVESVPNQTVKTQLTYEKPMKMDQLAEVTLVPSDMGTTVRWTVTGKNTFVGRLFCFFADMDKTVGGEFEKGLHQLKKTVESSLPR